MKRAWKIGIVISVLYVAAYLVLSITGGYEPGKSGRFTRFGLPTHDIYLWQLRYGHDSPIHDYSEFLPRIFAPLLWVDRKLWHRQIPMLRLDESGAIVDCPPPPSELLHPRVQKAQEIMMEYAARQEHAQATGSMENYNTLIEEMIEKLNGIYE